MPITMTVKRFRRNPFDYKVLHAAVTRAQLAYARGVAEMYLDTMGSFSDDHGEHSATPKFVEHTESRQVVNIYVRGGWARIYKNLDVGFMRKVAMVPGYRVKTEPGVLGSRPGGGKVGTRLTEPRPVVARRFTEGIAAAARSGQIEYGPYGGTMTGTFADYVRAALKKLIEDVSEKKVAYGRRRVRR